MIYRAIAVNRERQVFLVLGAGKIAQNFYAAYRTSENRERLRFIDVTGGASGDFLAGEGSPVVEQNAAVQLDQLGLEVSGVILAEELSCFRPEIIDRLVRMHFQKTPVYTLEIFLRNALATRARV